MATPGQIQIYSPARQLPPGFTGRQAPAPVRPSPQQQRAGRQATPALAGRWSALAPYVQAQSDKATQASAEEAAKKAQKAAQDAAYDKLPWYKKGLAAVIDNPVTKVALAPFEALSVPMKAVALGKEELSAHLPRGMAEWMEQPFGNGEYVDALNQIASLVPGSPFGVDTDKAREEKRGVLERLAPRSDFGHGQILKSTGSEWGDRFMGFGGDVLNDPLMLIEGGAEIVRPAIKEAEGLRALGQGERLALKEAPKALMTPERAAADAAARAASPLPTGVRTAEEEFARQAAGRGSAEARFAEPLSQGRPARAAARIKAPKNLQERMNLAAEWATENPELWRQHQGEVSKGIKRGFEAMSKEPRLSIRRGDRRPQGARHRRRTAWLRSGASGVEGRRRGAPSEDQ